MAKKTIAKSGRGVQVHYKGTFKDGTTFDSSYERGEPISFTVGAGEMIPGFDSAVDGMKVGQKKTVTLAPEQAYGPHNPEGVQEVNKQHFPEDFQFEAGIVIEGQVGSQPVRGIISTVNTETVTVDFNHPMAGKDLNFEIELVNVD
jgi:peptidylprolyl isomerase